jgi:hypothetical protein
VTLYGVSVFAVPPDLGVRAVLSRFAAWPFYLAATVGELRSSGFQVLPTGIDPDHFDVVLVDGELPDRPLLPLAALEVAARRLVEACRELRPNPSYAGRAEE